MRTAKLSSISAKHLGTLSAVQRTQFSPALAAQCLSATMAVVPYLKGRIEKYFGASHQRLLLADIDKILDDYVEHKKEIFEKFVSIMNDRIDFHSKAIEVVSLSVGDVSYGNEEIGMAGFQSALPFKVCC